MTEQKLLRSTDSATVIIGIGNEYRRDDAAGLIVARQLKNMEIPGVGVIEASGEGAALMESWKEAQVGILIDAVQSGARPGTIHCLDLNAATVPASFFGYSTHAFSVAEAIELARALNQLPPRVILYGIEGKNFEAGIGLSAEVKIAVKTVADESARLLAELRSAQNLFFPLQSVDTKFAVS
jgi:hydrogenase maturation protease